MYESFANALSCKPTRGGQRAPKEIIWKKITEHRDGSAPSSSAVVVFAVARFSTAAFHDRGIAKVEKARQTFPSRSILDGAAARTSIPALIKFVVTIVCADLAR